MGRHYSRSFDDVRVRTDAASTSAINAKAYTVGDTVTFAPGQYRPDTMTGQVVLSHELAHVAQQTTSGSHDGAIATGSHSDEVGANAGMLTGRVAPQGGPLRVNRCVDCNGPTQVVPRHAAPVKLPTVFMQPDAILSANIAATLGLYSSLSAADKAKAFTDGHAAGHVRAALTTLGARQSANAAPGATRDLLSRLRTAGEGAWVRSFLGDVEAENAVSESGQDEATMAQTQATFEAGQPPAAGWGGTPPGATRWDALNAAARTSWNTRATAARTAMATHVTATHPEFTMTPASFEWDPAQLDRISLGAIAAVGSVAGQKLLIGFEFVALVEVNAAYAMSTVAHELLGHVDYDEDGSNFQGELYEQSSTIDPTIPDGGETYSYWASEMYSLLREIPYWTSVSAPDQAQDLDLAGRRRRPQDLNFDPSAALPHYLRTMERRWDPALVVGMVRGFVERVRVDSLIEPQALSALEDAVRLVFPAEHARILR